MTFDLVIRGGTVVDGWGGPPVTADVAVSDGVIAAVGNVDEQGGRELDANGAVVAPGFVDIHTHYDGQVTGDDRLKPPSAHGVTTAVMGNCGVLEIFSARAGRLAYRSVARREWRRPSTQPGAVGGGARDGPKSTATR